MNGEDRQEVKNVVQATLRRLVWATVVVYVMLAALVVIGYLNSASQRDALAATVHTTTSALCALRGDLEQRVQTSLTFLENNPEGIPGISAKAIRDGIVNQQRTIDALAPLACP